MDPSAVYLPPSCSTGRGTGHAGMQTSIPGRRATTHHLPPSPDPIQLLPHPSGARRVSIAFSLSCTIDKTQAGPEILQPINCETIGDLLHVVNRARDPILYGRRSVAPSRSPSGGRYDGVVRGDSWYGGRSTARHPTTRLSAPVMAHCGLGRTGDSFMTLV